MKSELLKEAERLFDLGRPVIKFDRGDEYFVPPGTVGEAVNAFDLNRCWVSYSTKKEAYARSVSEVGDYVTIKIDRWLFRVSKSLVQRL